MKFASDTSVSEVGNYIAIEFIGGEDTEPLVRLEVPADCAHRLEAQLRALREAVAA